MFQACSQHKKIDLCRTKTRGSAGSIAKVTALSGISATENARLNERDSERKSKDRSFETTKQACPAFFVAFLTPLQ
jgi:hypothetical protein